ncbi:Phosphatidate cytidylyltransferase [Fulvivirga imtechensis AK7]|uniref:Phosphatidate cytidylyltransferase n=1 Tax=Fulvivirga imtechensis AK7 TaxID=1237149 RepID=L8JRE5_9BACT|nr:phosphatidate cytidylyltransferase [Fulvivirga imtechensis]ELR71440.1 Phosphatidate cytidylyltransferase [Fulvivirga imtechensis AK7]
MTSILNKYNNLTQRIIAALIGAFIIITSIWYSEWSYFLIFLLICTITQLEFYKLVGLDGMLPLKTFGTFCGLCIFILSFFIESGRVHEKYYFIIFPLATLIYLIYLYKKREIKPFRGIAFTFLGILYVAVPFSLLNAIAFFSGEYVFELILGSLLILWANDTGAYFAGVRYGKRKLFERVSPKKSWEGSMGGLVLALSMAYGLYSFTDVLMLWQWLAIGLIVIIGGTYGDLVESLFKRSIEIKDSGRLIPGHGGFLDRFDGLLLSAPFITTFLKIF